MNDTQRKLRELADRLDALSNWRLPWPDQQKLPQEQRDRLDAGVYLRRYADLMGPGRWLVIPPEGPGPTQFSAGTLSAAARMAGMRINTQLPFAVFDEFGKSADDRVQDLAFAAAYQAGNGLREALRRIKYDCSSLADAQVVALDALKGEPVATITAPSQAEPIDMVLFCPKCGLQHIDEPEFAHGLGSRIAPTEVTWANPPHRSHLCHGCGHIWRPADVPTNGVAAIKTKGKDDSPIVTPTGPASPEDMRVYDDIAAGYFKDAPSQVGVDLRAAPEGSREASMVVISSDSEGKPIVWCDPEIADLVRALNFGGLPTDASCSGHGHRPGVISLKDGRYLTVTSSEADWKKIESLFPVDINGEILGERDGPIDAASTAIQEPQRVEIACLKDCTAPRNRHHSALAASAPSQAEPTEIDYDKLIRDAWANHKYRQGTGACIAFKHGAEWQAIQAAPKQAGSCQASGEALLPCPFCGSEQVSASVGETGDGKPWHYIECEECAASAEPDVWNRRAPPAGRTLTDVINNMPITWELSWGSDDEEAPCNWRVHECSGSRNDREWKIIGEGATPADAILAASSTTAGDPTP